MCTLCTMQTPRERLFAQALFDVYKLLGGDTDGDPSPAAWIAGVGAEAFVQSILHDVEEHVNEFGALMNTNDELEKQIRHLQRKD